MIAPHIYIPDRELYRPRFSPWFQGGEWGELLERVKPFTLVSEASCYSLYTLAKQSARLGGELWECGVFQGGSAMLLADVLRRESQRRKNETNGSRLRLFDTFDGASSFSDPRYDVPYEVRDERPAEELAEASLQRVRERVLREATEDVEVSLHEGLIPETFSGLEHARIALAHIDVNLHKAVWDSCAFIYERLLPGGVMIFDDYGYSSCPGCRRAVDVFFQGKPEEPFISPTAQAIVFKLPPGEIC